MVELIFSKAAECRSEILVTRGLQGVILIRTVDNCIKIELRWRVGKQSYYLDRDRNKLQQWNIDFLETFRLSKNSKYIREEELDITNNYSMIVIIYANSFISLLYSQY